MRISVVGLGKLGAPIVAAFASRGHDVIGLDVNPVSVEALKDHRAPVAETDLQKYIDENRARISATSDWNELVNKSDISFVVVPTPSGPDGGFANTFVVSACERLGAALQKKDEFHLVVVVSTVMPGSSEKEIIPALEKASGKKEGRDFGYCYSPSLIALGSVIHDFLNPELVINGANDSKSRETLHAFYEKALLSKPVFHEVTPGEAELAKIGINTFITTKISFANMLGMIADAMPNVNVDNVTKILGSDSRIGHKYLKAGGSYGGPCFPRDNRAFTRAAANFAVATFIPKATDDTNNQYIEHIAKKVNDAIDGKPDVRVGIVGVAYKPNTDVIEEGMGLKLAHHLIGTGARVMLFDPSAAHSTKKHFGATTEHAESLEACLAASHVIVVTNPYKSHFEKINPALLEGKTMIDSWNVVPKARTS